VAEDWTFTEDCTLSARSTALVHGAPWSTTERALRYRFENGRLVMLEERDDGLLTTATPIHVNGQHLMLDAFTPVGEHSGLVGTWSSTVDTSLTNTETGETKYQTTHIQTLELTSAMTYTWRKRFIRDGVETPSEVNGTYEYNTTYASYVLRPAGAPSSSFTFVRFLDDQALRPGAPWDVFSRGSATPAP
jgi:hypothetical protein